MSKINQVSSSSQFSKLLSGNTYVIADFYADWCGPCKQIAPIFEQLATSHTQSGKLAFAKVNVDSQPDIARQYGVSAMPTFLVFKNSSVSDTIRGANPAALRTAVSRAAADAGKGPARPGANFQSKGYTLGTKADAGRPATAGSWFGNTGATTAGLQLGQGWADGVVRFVALYFTTLFSFDAYAAADASPFKVQRR